MTCPFLFHKTPSMPTQNDDNHNPYRATFIDEKPVDAARFFRATPEYRKLTPGSVGRTSYAVFMQHKWQFIGLGFAQGLFIALPVIAVFQLLIQHPDVARNQPWLPVVAVMILCLLYVFMIVVSVSATLRILRKERMIFLSTPRDAARLAWCMLHTLVYIVAWLGMLVLLLIPLLFGITYLTENWIHWSNFLFLFGVTLGILLSLVWVIMLIYVMTRLVYGVHLIIDHRMNCLAAALASWWHSRGNVKTIAFKNQGQNTNGFILLVLTYLTGGAGLIGWCYCDVTVTYLMLTGQCELLDELPDEW